MARQVFSFDPRADEGDFRDLTDPNAFIGGNRKNVGGQVGDVLGDIVDAFNTSQQISEFFQNGGFQQAFGGSGAGVSAGSSTGGGFVSGVEGGGQTSFLGAGGGETAGLGGTGPGAAFPPSSSTMARPRASPTR